MTNFVWPIILILNAVLVLLVAVFVLLKLHEDKKSGYSTNDERTIKIRGKVATGAFYKFSVHAVSKFVYNLRNRVSRFARP